MCRLFNLHELITHTSWSYSSLRVTFLSNLQEGATLSSDNRPGVEFYGWFGFGSSLWKERCLSRYSGARARLALGRSAARMPARTR